MADTSRVPIFPLNLVLFPGEVLPLHIFEERYKEMLQRCLRENIPFGIVLIRENSRFGRGSPHSVGTLARVTTVNEVPEGRCIIPARHSGECYHISCRGEDRFRVTNLDRREADYLVADIELFPDEASPPPGLAMVAQRVNSLFDDYYRTIIALNGGWQRQAIPEEGTIMFEALASSQARLQESGSARSGVNGPRVVPVPALPTDPGALSNIVATELIVQPDVKQELLELASALTRLQREAEIMAEETPQLEERLRLQNRRRYTGFGMSN